MGIDVRGRTGKTDLQTGGEGRKSRKRPTLVVGKKPNGKCQSTAVGAITGKTPNNFMSTITFRRTGNVNKNGSIPGEITIGGKSWPTIEAGHGHTFVRKGDYTLYMTIKIGGRPNVKCMSFNDDVGIQSHCIHDAASDSYLNLEGCIAPGKTSDECGIHDSLAAMLEIWVALNGWQEGKTTTITVENNILGDETREQWIQRRHADWVNKHKKP